MSTLTNRQNNSALMSESDNDDDLDQNSSTNQPNESMMHKVKDVVSKFLHPSFLFSAGDTSRSKRKRTISIENDQNEKTDTDNQTTTNGYTKYSKSQTNQKLKKDDEAELTDDEISMPSTAPSFTKDLSEPDQQKKRRRTANYHQISSTTTTISTSNGAHTNERTTPLTNTTNSVSFLSTRRLLDFESNGTSSQTQRSTEIIENEDAPRPSPTKQRFNTLSTGRSLTSNYDLSHSPLFSVANRKATETTMSPSRTTTNLKSNTNDFSANYLLATGLSQRSQISTNDQANQSISTLSNPNPNHSQRLLSSERQMFGVNYSSINSRRLPYIERLRRRTLQDCIRLNRTLDSEPLSISTIEEHKSAANTPKRNQAKAPEKDCGVQCNISTASSPIEPSRKVQRTFPPPEIRDEALSVPFTDKTSNISQVDSSLQTQSSIVIEPIRTTNQDLNKPKVLGNITTFSWPKFARAQEEFSKKYPDKCRADNILVPTSKPASNALSNNTNTTSVSNSMNTTIPKIPIFNASPPRLSKSTAGGLWKCPSCTMEHPAQTASCSMCYAINPNYKRLSVAETAIVSKTTAPTSDPIVEEPAVASSKSTGSTSMAVTNTITSAPIPNPIPVLTFSEPTTASNTFSTTTSLTTSQTSTNTSTTNISIPPLTTPISIGFSMPGTTNTSTSIAGNAPFSFGSSAAPTFPTFGTSSLSTSAITSTTGTTTTSSSFQPTLTTAVTTSAATATTTASVMNPISSLSTTPISFGTFDSTSVMTATTTASSSITTDRQSSFSFGASSSTPVSSSSSLTTAVTTSLATTTTTSSASVPANLFSFGTSSNPSTSATTTPKFGAAAATGAFTFGSSSAFGASTGATATTNPLGTNNTSMFGTSSSTNPSTTSTPSPFGISAATNSTNTGSSSLFTNTTAPSPAGLTFQSTAATTNPTSTTSTGTFSFGSNTSSSLFGSAAPVSTVPATIPTFGAATTTPATTLSGFGSSTVSTAAPATSFTGFGTLTTAPSASFGGFGSSNTSTTVPTTTFSGFGSSSAPTLTPATSFSSFGSSNTSTPFAFGATSNSTAINPNSTSGSTGISGGFSFTPTPVSSSSTSTAGSTLFNFSTTPSMNFGAIPSTSMAPGGFSFGNAQSGPSMINSFTPAESNSTQDNNPYSVGSDSAGKRPMAKAKRRANKT